MPDGVHRSPSGFFEPRALPYPISLLRREGASTEKHPGPTLAEEFPMTYAVAPFELMIQGSRRGLSVEGYEPVTVETDHGGIDVSVADGVVVFQRAGVEVPSSDGDFICLESGSPQRASVRIVHPSCAMALDWHSCRCHFFVSTHVAPA